MTSPEYPKPAVIRPFGVLDIMVLVVAAGPALVLLRERYEFYQTPMPPSVYRTVEAILAAATSVLIAFTLAMPIIVLRRPRAKLRVLLQRPGPAASLAAFVALVVMAIRFSVKSYGMMHLHGNFLIRYIYPRLVGGDMRVGFAVLGAWLSLLLTRGWRPEPSWVDRAGRLLGWGWVSLALFHVLLPWVKPILPPF